MSCGGRGEIGTHIHTHTIFVIIISTWFLLSTEQLFFTVSTSRLAKAKIFMRLIIYLAPLINY